MGDFQHHPDVDRVGKELMGYYVRCAMKGTMEVLQNGVNGAAVAGLVVTTCSMYGLKALREASEMDGPHPQGVTASLRAKANRGWEHLYDEVFDHAKEATDQLVADPESPISFGDEKHLLALSHNNKATGLVMQVILLAVCSCINNPNSSLDRLIAAGVDRALSGMTIESDNDNDDWR